MPNRKYLAISEEQALLIVDSFKMALPDNASRWQQAGRALALQAASLVLEFSAEAAITETDRVLEIAAANAQDVQDGPASQ